MKNTPASMQVAYCRTCKTAIAAGPIPVRKPVVSGPRRVQTPPAGPSHTVRGKLHNDVGLLEVSAEDWPVQKGPAELLEALTRKFKSEFE